MTTWQRTKRRGEFDSCAVPPSWVTRKLGYRLTVWHDPTYSGEAAPIFRYRVTLQLAPRFLAPGEQLSFGIEDGGAVGLRSAQLAAEAAAMRDYCRRKSEGEKRREAQQ